MTPIESEEIPQFEGEEQEEGSEEKEKKKKGDPEAQEAQVDFRVRGSADAADRALRKMGKGDEESQESPSDEEQESEEVEKIQKLLADPKNAVSITRTLPRRYKGRKADNRLERYQCPISDFEEIQGDVFERFGGKNFMAFIHPNTPTGFSRIKAAFPFENQEEGVPYEIEAKIQEEESSIRQPEGDPFAEEDPDPGRQLQEMIRERQKASVERLRTKQIERQLKDLEREAAKDDGSDDPRSRKERDQRDDRIRQLEEQLREQRLEERLAKVEDRFESKLDKMSELVERTISAVGSRPATPAKDNSDLFIAMMNSSDKRFSEMMQMVTSMNRATPTEKREGIDEMLEKISKFKNVFGADSEKSRRLEDMMYELTLERLTGGNGGSDEEEDPVKFAIKEGVPLLKDLINKRGGKQEISKEEMKKIYSEAMQDAAQKAAQRMIQQGYIEKNPQQGREKISGTKVSGARPSLPAPKKQGESQDETPATHKQHVISTKEGEVKVPPSPMSPNYNRKAAVDFVLSMLIEDIRRGCPKDTFVVGDILDRLDDEILTGLLKVGSADDLRQLLGDDADEVKIKIIEKSARENDRVERWIRQVIVTAQNEYGAKQEGEQGSGDSAA